MTDKIAVAATWQEDLKAAVERIFDELQEREEAHARRRSGMLQCIVHGHAPADQPQLRRLRERLQDVDA